jgi:hypothetical protein
MQAATLQLDEIHAKAPTQPIETTYPPHLWPYVEGVLRHHFAQQSSHLGSTWGASTDPFSRQAAYLHRVKPCGKCRGTGTIQIPRTSGMPKLVACHVCQGGGELGRLRRKGRTESTKRCSRCHGSGAWNPEAIQGVPNANHADALASVSAQASCAHCHGRGWLDGATVLPKGSPPSHAPTSAPERDGTVPNVLDRMLSAGLAQSVTVLEIVFSPATESLLGVDVSETVALWPITEAGAELLARHPNTSRLTPRRRLLWLAWARQQSSPGWLCALVSRAERTAMAMLAEARLDLHMCDVDGKLGGLARALRKRGEL